MQNKNYNQSINTLLFARKKKTNTMDFIEKLVDQQPNILYTTTQKLNKELTHGKQANEKHKGKKFCTFALFTWVV